MHSLLLYLGALRIMCLVKVARGFSVWCPVRLGKAAPELENFFIVLEFLLELWKNNGTNAKCSETGLTRERWGVDSCTYSWRFWHARGPVAAPS